VNANREEVMIRGDGVGPAVPGDPLRLRGGRRGPVLTEGVVYPTVRSAMDDPLNPERDPAPFAAVRP
jgi:hypothetical protein